MFQALWRVILVLGAAAAVFGCSTDSKVRLASVSTGYADVPQLPTGTYLAEDENSATVYLTDLDSVALDRGTSLASITGRIVQIKMFLRPVPGSTPIASDACSATIRHIILARGNIGVYSGGGFMKPKGRVGDAKLSGYVEGATMRLTGKIGNFTDRLNAATLEASFNTQRDEALARRIGVRVDDVLLLLGEKKPDDIKPEVSGPRPKDPAKPSR